MKRTNRELDQVFEDTMGDIRQERLDENVVKSSTDRVWRRLSSDEASSQLGVVPVEHIRGCDDFQTLIPAYLGGYLSSARSMLLEDHTHECIPCRKALKQARAVTRGETVVRATAKKVTARRAPVFRFAIAAVLIVGVGVVSWPWIQDFTRSVGALNTIVQAANGNVVRISDSRTQAVGSGQRIGKGERIRTAKDAGAVLKLSDGSTVEMSERSELSVSENSQGTTINLERGQIIVEAAKQGDRHLYVATKDSLTSVKGTIFAVNSGTKGSRVSVVEGEVHVDHSNQRSILHAGDQVSTHASIDRVAVKQEVLWSSNAQKYAKVLDEVAALRKEIDAQVARPGVRYSTHLLDLAPENTAIYVAIPNITKMLAEANAILEERVQQNPDLREWWAKEGSKRGMRSVIDKVTEIGSYLGPEIVLCAEVGAHGEPNEPVVLAEVINQGGLETFIQGQFAALGGEGKKGKSIQFVSDPAQLPAKASGDGLFIWMKDDVLAASPAPQSIAKLASTLINPEANKFASSPFRAQLAEIYRDGAGLLIAADLQKLVRTVVPRTAAGDSDEMAAAERLGLLNVKYFIAELKEKDGRASNRAMLSFTEKKGLSSWLATPGPMGALEFISPDATVVAAFVAERPVSVLDDLLGALKTAKPEVYEEFKAFETQHGINVRDDFAAPLGGEFAFAIDGPLLPIPSWKAVIEVNDQVKMQQSIEQAISEINNYATSHEKKGLSIEHAGSGDRVFHTIKALDAAGIEVCYTYAYGYLIAAPTRALVERAIQYHDSSVSLMQSAKFKSTLPEDKQANFSAMLYYNIGPAVTPLMKQGLPVPKKAAVLSLTKPTLAYIYSQGDSFTLSANTEDGPIGLTPSMLMGLPGGLGGLIK